MKKTFKKALSVFLVAVMVFGSAPLAGLVGIEFPSLKEVFADKAEAATDGILTYEVNNGEVTIIDFSESLGGAYEIPSSIKGYPVTSIGNSAFEDCYRLTSVTIPDSVTSIGNYAFYYCRGLTSVTIGDSVTSIGNSAFASCSGLTSVTIPNSVKNIGQSAFSDCYRLTSITIPDSVMNIRKNAFLNSGIYDDSSNWEKNVLYIGNHLIKARQDYIDGFYSIKSGTATIADEAFINCDELASVRIPNSVKSIGGSAFRGCRILTSVIIGNGVTSIGNAAFRSCIGLTSVTIGNSVSFIDNDAFNYCDNLTDVYYTSTEEQWVTITIGKNNEDLTNTTIHYNYTITYTARFKVGSNIYKELKFEEGAKITVPLEPSKEGYSFLGWTPKVPDTMPANNLVFTAIWEANNYDAVFNANGGKWPDGTTKKIYSTEYDTKIVVPEAPEKQGYIFLGWTPDVGIMDDINGKEFNAKWALKSGSKYTIETYIMNTSGNYEKVVQTSNAPVGSIVNAEYEISEGFILNSTKSVISGIVSEDNSLVLRVYIDRKKYSFTTVIDGVATETKYYYGSIIAEPAIPVKAGYTFVCWTPSVPSTMPAENLILTATWEANNYDSVFNANGGKWPDGTTKKNYSTEYDTGIVAPEAPEKEGYSFLGWTPEVPDTMPANNLVFTAIWEANNYDAVFNANGGKWPDGTTKKIYSTEYDTKIVVPEAPEKQGYIFLGWTPDVGIMDDINGKEFNAKWALKSGSKYTIETYIMNTSGNYEKVVQTSNAPVGSIVNAEYEISEGFILNSTKSVISGIVSEDNSLVLRVYIDRKKYSFTTVIDGVATETKYYYGSIIAEPAIPVKAGYTFVCWTPSVPSTMPAYDLTFTAVFEKIETPTENEIKVSIRNPSTTTINYGDAIILHADITEDFPAGARIEWTSNNGNFDMSVSTDGLTCKISPKSSGKTVFTATVYDKDGNVISSDTQEMTAKAGFFDKIVAFFKKIFGLTKTIPEAFKDIL